MKRPAYLYGVITALVVLSWFIGQQVTLAFLYPETHWLDPTTAIAATFGVLGLTATLITWLRENAEEDDETDDTN